MGRGEVFGDLWVDENGMGGEEEVDSAIRSYGDVRLGTKEK